MMEGALVLEATIARTPDHDRLFQLPLDSIV
jgi:hypothetical protein